MTRKPRIVAALLPLLPLVALQPAYADGVRLRGTEIVYSGPDQVALRAPEGVAFKGPDTLVVADTGNGRLVFYGPGQDGFTPRAVQTVSELAYPVRLAARKGGELLVLDGRSRRVGILGADGAFKGFVNPAVEGDVVPRSLRVDAAGQLYLLDVAGARVIVLDAEGKVQRQLPLPRAKDTFFSDLALDAKGNVFVLESIGRRLLVFRAGAAAAEPFGKPLSEDLDFASAIETDAAGHVFVADQHGGGVVVLGPDGAFRGRAAGDGWKDGLLRYPSALATDGARLFVADRGNNRVQVYTIVP